MSRPATEMADAAIAVRDLVKTFKRRGQSEIRAVDGLTFSVRRGSIFGLLGPNGAGKTTTFEDVDDAAPSVVWPDLC